MKRRTLAITAAAGVAATSGLAGFLWRDQQRQQVDLQGQDAALALWSMPLPQPDGGQLVLAALGAPQVVVNFWAPWCVPCVREMPVLDQFHRSHAARGWPVVGLAIDTPQPVVAFLKRVPVSFPIALIGAPGLDLGRRLGNLAGGLPFTVVIAKDGRVLQRKLGETSLDELHRWAGGA